MAARKYYAVKKGKVTGVFQNWEDCKASVDGYPGAVYKSFSTLREANAFVGVITGDTDFTHDDATELRQEKKVSVKPADKPKNTQSDLPPSGTLLAYVDGSYEDSIRKYAFGCVFILPDGHIFTEYGNGDQEQSLQHRNVTGEMLGAMYAVKTAMLNGFTGIEIRYDYQGIEKWVTGEWRSKTELTMKYAKAMRDWGKDISIRFTKVAGHTNVTYNELADKMAKRGLTEGNGVPKVRLLEELERYNA